VRENQDLKKQKDSITHSKLCRIDTNDINGAVMVLLTR